MPRKKKPTRRDGKHKGNINEYKYPELVFSITGAIGTDLHAVQESLAEGLREVGYTPFPIHLSHLMEELKGEPWDGLADVQGKEYFDRYMKAGNKLCSSLQMPDALTRLAMSAMRNTRKKLRAADPGLKLAFILNSLKRSEEVKTLRRVYGPCFFSVSAYSPRAKRVDRLTRILAEKNNSNKIASFRPQAEALVQRDENERVAYGQDVRKTYPLSDCFVNASDSEGLKIAVLRLIQLIFGDPWQTPSRDEQGMAAAQLASCRSASPARQVGAAITSQDGSLISIGTNDIAKVGGGLYWDRDQHDGRDFKQFERDTSDQMKENLVADILTKLRNARLLTASCTARSLLYGEKAALKDAQVLSTIDFVRAVHAEMTALLDALKRGTKLGGAVLYTTTFPCHDCAKHIVAAGITRVVYVEPYPKSLVAELYPDSIAVDSDSHGGDRVQFEQFVGVAPRLYNESFHLGQKGRKREDGTFIRWNAQNAFPQIDERYSELRIHVAETDVIELFLEKRKERGI